MFGGRKKRVDKLSAGAASNLENGEQIRELVQTQTGQSASAVMNSEFLSAQTGRLRRVKINAAPHVLVATDENLYAMTLSGARLLDVGEVDMKVPRADADLRRDGRKLIFDGVTFHVMALFGEHADRLCEYVESRQSVSPGASGAAR